MLEAGSHLVLRQVRPHWDGRIEVGSLSQRLLGTHVHRLVSHFRLGASRCMSEWAMSLLEIYCEKCSLASSLQ